MDIKDGPEPGNGGQKMKISDDQTDHFLNGFEWTIQALDSQIFPEILSSLCQLSSRGVDMTSLALQSRLPSIFRSGM
jgi:hypothetical protein